jgi:hypothetical protein
MGVTLCQKILLRRAPPVNGYGPTAVSLINHATKNAVGGGGKAKFSKLPYFTISIGEI